MTEAFWGDGVGVVAPCRGKAIESQPTLRQITPSEARTSSGHVAEDQSAAD